MRSSSQQAIQRPRRHHWSRRRDGNSGRGTHQQKVTDFSSFVHNRVHQRRVACTRTSETHPPRACWYQCHPGAHLKACTSDSEAALRQRMHSEAALRGCPLCSFPDSETAWFAHFEQEKHLNFVVSKHSIATAPWQGQL
eukprot:3138017-Rhodomonas_salina.3